MKRLIAFAALAALAFAGEAAAQVRLLGTTSARMPTVYSVVKDFGCHPDWFSKAMSDSGIESLRPRLGTRVIIKTPRCAIAPPESVARRSRELLASAEPRKRPAQAADSEVPALRSALSASEKKGRELENRLAEAQSSFKAELAKIKTPPAPAVLNEKHPNNLLIMSALGLLALGAAGMFLFGSLRGNDQVCYREVWKVPDGEKDREFKFVGTVADAGSTRKPLGLYRCGCGETVEGRRQALEEHLKNKCPLGKVTSNMASPTGL